MCLPFRPWKIFHAPCNFCETGRRQRVHSRLILAGRNQVCADWAKSAAFSSLFRPWYFR
jgi:hypothetical protein